LFLSLRILGFGDLVLRTGLEGLRRTGSKGLRRTGLEGLRRTGSKGLLRATSSKSKPLGKILKS
jgi:hypothetical protein